MNRNMVRVPVLQALTLLGVGGSHAPNDVRAKVRTLLPAEEQAVTEEKLRSVINDAVWDLRQRGLVVNSGRTWVVTEKGVEVGAGAEMPARLENTVHVFKKGENGAPPAANVAPTPDKPAAPTPDKPAVSRLRVFNTAPVGAATVPAAEWLADDYVRAAVAKNQPCFGSFSPSHEACGGCALVGHCRGAQAGALELLAVQLKAAAPGPLPTAAAGLHGAVAGALNPRTARVEAELKDGAIITTSFDGLDAVTGAPIKRGTRARYVAGKGFTLTELDAE